MVESVAYWLAVLLLVSLPPALLWWFIIHPFAAFWRRLGPWATYIFVILACVAAGYGIWQIREPILVVRHGFNPVLTAIGVVLYVLCIYIELERRKHLTLKILVGLPEVSGDGPGKLLNEGIYAKVRHPRYVAFFIGILAWALFINYRAIYVMCLLMVPVIYLLVLIEERELRERFGEAYVEYARNVPRFVPRRRS